MGIADIVRITITGVLLFYVFIQAGWSTFVLLLLLCIEREAIVIVKRRGLKSLMDIEF